MDTNPTITLKSGRILELQFCEFDDGTKLYKVISAELLKVNVSFKLTDLKTVMNRDIGELKNLFLQLLASDTLEAAIFKCAAPCTLDGQRITRSTFSDPKFRGDWFPVAFEILKFTLAPFFANLGFDLSALAVEATSKAEPAQKS